MTVCYGFVCRRREILDFTPGDRAALTQIMNAGHASAAAERAAVQKAVIWFDRRMGPIIGTDKRVAKADFRYFDDKHNYDCWDTTRNTTSLLLVLQEWGLFKFHVVGDPHYRGNTLVLQTPHNTAGAGRSRHQGRMGRRPLAARLSAAARRHDGSEMGDGRLSARRVRLSAASKKIRPEAIRTEWRMGLFECALKRCPLRRTLTVFSGDLFEPNSRITSESVPLPNAR